jgi:NADH:ubiquinone oxidoreductase subunit 3 (subunit A)
MAVIGIGVPLGGFVTSYMLSPHPDRNDPTKMRSFLLRGYESDQSLYRRRLSTYECGAEPLGEAMIQFHYQYYWYAIIFLVFDIAFMFLALGGVVVAEVNPDGTGTFSRAEAQGALTTLIAFLALMGMGVWYVFRKRGRIYI